MRALVVALALAACTSKPAAPAGGSGAAAPVQLRTPPAQLVQITLKSLGIT